ncbi:phosphatase PAP2 family protein [Gluconacetobacter entanii]|uniref:acid phosphatase n=1 Tax=Gluconacetobacter entanii TaxID=108528 RepID=UPI001C93208E|nr:phosphatase PAP2 family protein [Gluconacetobacter entanii]MBY4638428.1 phosphatase PAP2 family protein [Gluconacetobacter entanii]MCW4579172.1 phosphatase PAP2 family protein [Gluconacetobacter entanii]MCW4582562.1 phosphatase PAP2 family protein [Gluconacetobacter entanii]MCW4585957.1 phosphatase PAP2 family protein [Gluconacetobacter entanii]
MDRGFLSRRRRARRRGTCGARAMVWACMLAGGMALSSAHAHRAAPPPSPPGPPLPDGRIFLPPPPAPETASNASDASIFADTRVQEGSGRWKLAQRDARHGVGHMLSAFSCAAGFTLSSTHLPRLEALLTRLEARVEPVVAQEKAQWNRPRPYSEIELPLCVADRGEVARTPSYPSTYATLGWMTGAVLSDLLPTRTAQIMRRARIYGESRVICGVHWHSDITAGWMNGAVLYTAMRGEADFARDLDAARAEIEALRDHPPAHVLPPDANECAEEEDAAAHSPQ